MKNGSRINILQKSIWNVKIFSRLINLNNQKIIVLGTISNQIMIPISDKTHFIQPYVEISLNYLIFIHTLFQVNNKKLLNILQFLILIKLILNK